MAELTPKDIKYVPTGEIVRRTGFSRNTVKSWRPYLPRYFVRKTLGGHWRWHPDTVAWIMRGRKEE